MQGAGGDVVVNPHSPREERLLSNIGHWLEGSIITAAGVVSLRRAFAGGDAHPGHEADVLLGAGSVLGLGLIAGSFHHGGPRRFFSADMQQREHLEMSGLIAGAGVLRKIGGPAEVLSNALVARVGQMFLVHEQHGTDEAAARSKKRHEILGKTIVGAAASGLVADLTHWRSARALAGATLLAAGAQLLTYREPEGAYETDGHGTAHTP